MPLRVKNGEAWLEAWALSDEAWGQLERENRAARHLRFPCCGSAAVLRTSHLGTRYFAHLPSQVTCTEREASGESFAHLHAKALVAQAATQLGWHARTEAAGDGWRADVLLERAGVRVAVEIQLSAQSWAVTLERSERYRAAGIACLWLVGRSFRQASRLAPVATLGTYRELVVTAPGLSGGVPVAEFLAGALDGRFAFRSDRLPEPALPKIVPATIRFEGFWAQCDGGGTGCGTRSISLTGAWLEIAGQRVAVRSLFDALFFLPEGKRREVIAGLASRRPKDPYKLGPLRLNPPGSGSRHVGAWSLCHVCSSVLPVKPPLFWSWRNSRPTKIGIIPSLTTHIEVSREQLVIQKDPFPEPEKWSWRWDKTPAEPFWHPFRVDTVSTEGRVTALATENEP